MKKLSIGFKAFGVIMALIILSLVVKTCSAGMGVFDKTVNSDNIIESYEEYEEMYSTCEKICDDIRILSLVSAEEYNKDTGFSKSERLIALKANLNRWIREYNAKSRMFRKNMWKSKKLPHQLSISHFDCQ